MNLKIFLVCFFILLQYYSPMSSQAQMTDWKAESQNGLVIAGKSAAALAGLEILEKGGNAADAAVASLLALSVKAVGAFCIGGEVPLIIFDASRNEVKVLSGQGAAPLDPKAIQWYMENGIPGNDIRAAAVPAALDLCVTTLQHYGTMSFAEVAAPTLRILDAGGPTWYIDTSDGDTIDTGQNWYADLAVTFRKLIQAEKNAIGSRKEKLQAVSNRFYRGDIADELEAWYIEKGGFLRKADLIAHVTRIEDPEVSIYKGYTVYKCGPWTQGPYLLQALRLIEGFDLQKMGQFSADYIHLVAEAMKLALADRDAYYGDPRFVNVPLLNLLSDQYTKIRTGLIDMEYASLEIRPGDPFNMKPLIEDDNPHDSQGGTTTLCVADQWGNVVAATPSGLGSTAGVAGNTGIIHGTRLVSLNTWKGHPNCIAPGKRPRITLTPTLVLKNGKPVLAISIAGGDLQDQVALQLILDNVDFGMLPAEAVKAPRFATGHHTGSFGQDKPNLGSLTVNENIDVAVIHDLEKRGHKVRTTSHGIGGAAMLYIDPENQKFYGAGSAVSGLK
jgi:gamma-glutamyltranspeptidase/glutathione hydrolase